MAYLAGDEYNLSGLEMAPDYLLKRNAQTARHWLVARKAYNMRTFL
jgi:hypothetical protein